MFTSYLGVLLCYIIISRFYYGNSSSNHLGLFVTVCVASIFSASGLAKKMKKHYYKFFYVPPLSGKIHVYQEESRVDLILSMQETASVSVGVGASLELSQNPPPPPSP
jgi:hypothetical protein